MTILTIPDPAPVRISAAGAWLRRLRRGKDPAGLHLGIFHHVMNTVTLGVPQWLLCTAVALPVVVAAEIRKTVRRRTTATIVEPAGARPAGATAS